MRQYWLVFVVSICFGLSSTTFAQQTGNNSEMKNTCEVSGGRWVESGSGNWACCWANWGCYGCVDGNCKMKCDTQRCKDANGQKRPGSGETAVEGLAPTGKMSPIIPKKAHPIIKPSSSNSIKIQ